MSWLVGTGAEGKMQELEERVRHHDESLQRLRVTSQRVGKKLEGDKPAEF